MLFKKIFLKSAIDYAEALEKINKGALLVDVRSKEEYNFKHAKGAINVDLEKISSSKKLEKEKDKDIILYCNSGARSGQALNILKSKGFEKVFNLGGLSDWKGELE